MRIIDLEGPRFELALERLIEGHSFTFQDVWFWISPRGELEVSIESSWALQNVTRERALVDLGRAQVLYQELRRTSPSFDAAVENRTPVFILIHDYGTGAVEFSSLS